MDSKRYDKILGALFGFAVGDAMGATVEFMTEKQIKERYGKITDIVGGGWLGLKAGEVTDDTQMMLCVIRAIEEVGHDYYFKLMQVCRDNFVKWYDTNPKDIGCTCANALWLSKMTGSVIACESDDAQGNGSLMRALPLALLGDHEMNVIQGAITHNSSACRMYIKEYSKTVFDVLNCAVNESVLKEYSKCDPTGWVGAAFNNAMYYFKEASSFESGMIAVVNDGGDADTIAAITGGLLGAKFGVSNIPKAWIEKLDENVKKELTVFARYVENDYKKNKM